MVSKENKKLIFGIILAALVFLSYQVIASYMTNPVDTSLKYPNPGHYPGEIGPGTFNASNSANPYWSFPDSSGDRFTGLEIINGEGQFYKTLQVFNNFYTYANTYLGNDSSDKTTVKGDLNVTGGIVVGNPDEGNKGPGTINAEKIYVNGNEISSVEGLNRSEILDMLYFGSGKDGDVVITSDTTVSRDMEYRNLTVKSGATLNPNGWRIFVSDTLTIEEGGKISRDGNDGGNAASCPGWGVCWRCPGSGGAPLQAHTVGGSGGGASGSCGNAGDGESGEAGGNGGNGGDAENGARSGGNGGAGGNKIINYLPSPFMSFLSLPVEIAETGGAGGGGGAGYTSASGRSAGGGGGSGGGVIHIFAKNIILNGNITAKGGKGGNGVCGCSCGSCSHLYYAAGGGGGGGGGFILLVYKTKTGSGTIDVSGGEGGKGCTDYYGDVGEDGEDGKAGYIKEFQITY